MAICAGLLALAASAHAQSASVQRGHALVRRNCAMCHATEREGPSPNPRAPPFRELHNRYPVEDLAEALAEGILVGHPEMPELRFEPQQIEDIIHYLEEIQTKQKASLPIGAGAPLLQPRSVPSQ
jgi:mono/diheme cytochrome c family protein